MESRTSRETGGLNYDRFDHRHSAFGVVVWVGAALGVQPELGIWAERWSRADTADRRASMAAWANMRTVGGGR